MFNRCVWVCVCVCWCAPVCTPCDPRNRMLFVFFTAFYVVAIIRLFICRSPFLMLDILVRSLVVFFLLRHFYFFSTFRICILSPPIRTAYPNIQTILLYIAYDIYLIYLRILVYALCLFGCCCSINS